MHPQSFIVGLMAGIILFGGGILIAMILLERPRYGTRCWPRLISGSSHRLRVWLQRMASRQKVPRDGGQAEEDYQRLRETVLDELERRRSPAKRRLQGSGRKNDPPNDD